MNLQFYLEKLNSFNEFREFSESNNNFHLCSGFFVIDKEGNDNKTHLDFFSPKSKEIASFQLEDGIKKVSVENLDKREFEKISDNLDFDFKEIEDSIAKRMKEEKIKNKVQKIILSLQKSNEKEMLFGTVFLSGFGILKISMSLPEKEIIEFGKKSLFDIINVLKKD